MTHLPCILYLFTCESFRSPPYKLFCYVYKDIESKQISLTLQLSSFFSPFINKIEFVKD